jgi:hypothetical protein
VRRAQPVVVVVGQLEAWDDEHPVRRERAIGLGIDGVEVVAPVVDSDERTVALAAPDGVIGDAEDVEPVFSVEVDEGGERQRAVAPVAVCVQLGEEQRSVHACIVRRARGAQGNEAVKGRPLSPAFHLRATRP